MVFPDLMEWQHDSMPLGHEGEFKIRIVFPLNHEGVGERELKLGKGGLKNVK